MQLAILIVVSLLTGCGAIYPSGVFAPAQRLEPLASDHSSSPVRVIKITRTVAVPVPQPYPVPVPVVPRPVPVPVPAHLIRAVPVVALSRPDHQRLYYGRTAHWMDYGRQQERSQQQTMGDQQAANTDLIARRPSYAMQ